MNDITHTIEEFKENFGMFLKNHQVFEMVLFFSWHIARGLLLASNIFLVYVSFMSIVFFAGIHHLYVISFFWSIFCFFSCFGINKWKLKAAVSVLFQLFFFFKLIVWVATERQQISFKSALILFLYFGGWWIFLFGQFCYAEFWKDNDFPKLSR